MTHRYAHLDPGRERALAQLDPSTRSRVEQAALTLFSEREFHRVKLISIAREAHISLQTLYKYYGSKETVLFASLDTWLGALAGRVDDHLQGIESCKERLRKVLWLLLEYFERNPKVARILLSAVYLDIWRAGDSFRQPALMSVLLGVIKEGQAQGVLTRAIDDRTVDEIEIADFICGVTYQVMAMWLRRQGKRPLTEKTPALFDMVWRAIASNAALADDLPRGGAGDAGKKTWAQAVTG